MVGRSMLLLPAAALLVTVRFLFRFLRILIVAFNRRRRFLIIAVLFLLILLGRRWRVLPVVVLFGRRRRRSLTGLSLTGLTLLTVVDDSRRRWFLLVARPWRRRVFLVLFLLGRVLGLIVAVGLTNPFVNFGDAGAQSFGGFLFVSRQSRLQPPLDGLFHQPKARNREMVELLRRRWLRATGRRSTPNVRTRA